MLRKSFLSLFCLMLSIPTALVAQETRSKSMDESQAGLKMRNSIINLKSACRKDLNKFCKNVNPGEGRLAACLQAHEDQLSDNCDSAWLGTQETISQEMDKTEIAFRKSCGSDVQQFCADVPSGRGRILDCLEDHEDELSNSCQNFQAKLDEKLSSLFG